MRLKCAVVALIATSFAAHAADLAPIYKAPAAVPVPTVYNWTGFYIGGNAGGYWSNWSSPIAIAASPSTAASTLPFGGRDTFFVGGAQAGYNWQFDQWVFGVEGDWDAKSWRSRTTIGAAGVPFLFLPGDSFEAKSDWEASARLRVGYAWGPLLAYATGGVAFTDFRVSTAFGASGVFPGSSATSNKTLIGGTIGGGLEYAIGHNLSLGVEGRYTDYGGSTANLGSLAVFGPPFVFSAVSSRSDLNSWEVTGRLNWRFDWGAPVVAKY